MCCHRFSVSFVKHTEASSPPYWPSHQDRKGRGAPASWDEEEGRRVPFRIGMAAMDSGSPSSLKRPRSPQVLKYYLRTHSPPPEESEPLRSGSQLE